MASHSYIRKKQKKLSEINSKKGKFGNEVKRKLMQERAAPLKVVGGLRTYGNMGEHHIQLLDGGDESQIWIVVDGEIRTPRTMIGFFSVMNRWVWKATRQD